MTNFSSQLSAPSGAGHSHRRNDHKSMRHRPFIGDGQIDARLITGWRDLLQPALGAASEFDRRTARWQIDDTHVAPPHTGPQPGTERFRASFLGRKALGVSLESITPPVGQLPFDLGEHPVRETVAVALDHPGDAPRVADIGADTENHDALALRRPRSIAARIVRTTDSSPSKIASPIMKCPIFSSAISGNAAILSAVT